MERFGLRLWSRLQFSALAARKSAEIMSLIRNIHRQGQYHCSLPEVQEFLKSYKNVHFHPGIFPKSSEGVEEQMYAFAHFDVDLYDGTKACLEYFYPRMTPGGIMLSHDYDILAGVSQAFHEFFADKPETIIEQPTTQCMVVKR